MMKWAQAMSSCLSIPDYRKEKEKKIMEVSEWRGAQAIS